MKNKTLRNFFSRRMMFKIFVGETVARKLFSFYTYAILIGFVLLSLPISLTNMNEYVKYVYDPISNTYDKIAYTPIDAFFTSVSAFSDTGLSTFSVFKTYNVFGQIVVLILIQIGGFGLFTVYWIFWNYITNSFLYKKIKKIDPSQRSKTTLSTSLLISSERGNSKLGLTKETIKIALLFIFVVELMFAILYIFMFYYIPAFEQTTVSLSKTGIDPNLLTNWNHQNLLVDSNEYVNTYHNIISIWVGIFHSVSAVNNAGFDIIGSDSLAPYRNGLGTILQYTTIIQVIIGGIGYPIIYDLYLWVTTKHRNRKFKFSFFTKVSLISYFVITLIGLSFMFGIMFSSKTSFIYNINKLLDTDTIPLEAKIYLQSYFGKNRIWNEITSVVFFTINAKSSGFSTIAPSHLSSPAQWIMIVMMFIGCSPSSTGGGIRTTTLAIMIWTVVSKFRKNNGTVIFNREIPKRTVTDSFTIFSVALFSILLLSLISYCVTVNTNPEITMSDEIFEFASAFGTVGLSSGVTGTIVDYSATSIINAILLCSLMIVGQLGIPTTLFAFQSSKEDQTHIYYPEEDIKIS